MVKKAKKLCAFRLEEEVWFEIQERAVRGRMTQAEVIEAAIKGGVTAAQVVPEQATVETQGAPFHPLCRHCGDDFPAWNRNASLCPDCKGRGHEGEPRNCYACLDSQGAL